MTLRKPLDYLILAVALAPALYWMTAYTGPYAWLMEVERARLGWSSGRLTFAALVVALYVPLRLIAGIRTVERVADPSAPAEVSAPRRETWQRSALIAGGATAILFAMAAWWFSMSVRAGQLRRVTAADFAAGRVAEPAFVEVEGEALPHWMRVKESGGETRLYIPVAGASLVVEADEKEKPALFSGDRLHAIGIARTGILEGEIRAAFREAGIVLGETIWVVQTAQRPSEGRRASLIFAGGALAIGGIIYAMRRRVLG